MGLSPSAVVIVSIVGAMFMIGVVAVVHRIYTGPPDAAPANRRFYDKHNRTSEQQDRILQVREINNRHAWERARKARQEAGLPVPQWYPGSQWLFSAQGTVTQPSLAELRTALSQQTFEQDHRLVEQDVLRCPNRIGHAYQHVDVMYPREDLADTGLDEYGMPIHPFSARFSQRGSLITNPYASSHEVSETVDPHASTQRLARPVRQYALAEEEEEGATDEVGWEMDNLVNHRSSSVYSTIDLDAPPMAPPAAHVRSSMHLGRQPSRVHHLVERWEAVNGR